MPASTPVRVFIGSGEASLIERKTLIYSLRKNTRRPLDLHVFNGTHNAVEHDGEEPVLAPMSLRVKYHNFTEFSNYRFLIPQLCGHQGRAIYLDSDMVCLGDIGELFDRSMDGLDFVAKQEAYAGTGRWGLSVMLIDCARCRFDLDAIFAEIDQGLYTFEDFHQMAPAFLERHSYRIGELDPNWNVFDVHDASTKLIHYTNLFTQPWRKARHPYGELWSHYFREAKDAGVIADRDVHVSQARGYAREDILEGNDPPRWVADGGGPSLPRRLLRRARRILGTGRA